ncbi:zf-TFIIB domain-containing protein [Luedemannella flava]
MTGPTNVLRCPKCQANMRTYERNGVHLEQCESCRGIFLDFGELEALTRLEAQMAAPPPPPPQQQHAYPQHQPPPAYPPQPGYGGYGYGHGHRKRGFGGLFFSS